MQVAQGGTISLPVEYHNASNALVDPPDPLLDVLDPTGAQAANDLVPVRDDVGRYHYDWTAAADAMIGEWTARWSGTIDGLLVAADDPFNVVASGYIGPSALITLDEFNTAMGVAAGDVDAVRDARYTQAILGASAAVAAYADRDFGTPNVTEQRTFEYDGSGFVDIDDASAVTDVTFSTGGTDTVLDATLWRVEPYGAPVYSYLVVPTWEGGYSPEMGFTKNLDVLYRERGWGGLGTLVKVTGTWGWPDVPGDVKQAVIWTAAAFAEDPKPYQSESIAGYSVTQGPTGQQVAIPDRVKEILAPYVRYKVG